MVASQKGHLKIVDLLWKFGDEVNDVRPLRNTPLLAYDENLSNQ